jgi:hypothetical protein
MAAGATYEPIATTTLGSTQTSVTFSSIPSTYTDIILVSSAAATTSTGQGYGVQFNSDTGSNYSKTFLYGNGSSAVSGRASNQTNISISNFDASGTPNPTIAHIQNYANTTTYKTVISRGGGVANFTIAYVGLWRSTSAITSMTLIIDSSTFTSGSVFTLYGIAAA